MATRNLTIRGVPGDVLDRIRDRAGRHRRSMNGEVIAMLEAAVAADRASASPASATPASGLREESALYVAAANPLESIDAGRLADVCRRHHIRWLAVFGSVARGDAQADSDVDVIVEFEAGHTPGWGIIRVAEALRVVFGGRRVDLVTVRELGRLHDSVMASAKTLYGAR